MLFYFSRDKLRYCHFDEYNFDELKSFAHCACQERNKGIGFLGGWGSKNVPKLIKHLNNSNLGKSTSKDFVDFFPVKKIQINDGIFSFLGENCKKAYSFSEINGVLNR